MARNSWWDKARGFAGRKQSQFRRGDIGGYFGIGRNTRLPRQSATTRSTSMPMVKPPPTVGPLPAPSVSSYTESSSTGIPSSYGSAYEAALTRQRSLLEDDFKRAIGEVGRREQSGLQLAKQQVPQIEQLGEQIGKQMRDFQAGAVQAQAAAGLPSFEGTEAASLNPFLAASQLAGQGSLADAAMLPVGVSELANRQRGGLEAGRAELLAQIEGQKTERAMRLEEMMLSQTTQTRDPYEQRLLEMEIAEKERALIPRQFGAGEISVERGNALTSDYEKLPSYRAINNTLLSILTDPTMQPPNPAVFIPRFLADPIVRRNPIIASQVLARMAGVGGQGG